jgi:hypothetical protein
MSRNKKILIGAIVVVVLLVLGYFLLRSKNTPPVVIDDTGGTTTGTGGLVKVGATPIYDGRGGLVVKTDPAKPFISVTPRAADKIPTTVVGGGSSQTPVGVGDNANFQDYNKALASGLIPDKDGLYTQIVNPIGDNPYTQNAYDYTLGSTDFLSKYYPDVQTTLYGSIGQDYLSNGAYDPGTSTHDPLIVENNPGVVVPGTDTTDPNAPSPNDGVYIPYKVPTWRDYSGPNFPTTTDNSFGALKKYIRDLSNITKPYDLVHNTNLMTDILRTQQDYKKIDAEQAKAQAVRDHLPSLVTPTNLIGFSQHYWELYDYFVSIAGSQHGVVAPDKGCTFCLGRITGGTAQKNKQDALSAIDVKLPFYQLASDHLFTYIERIKASIDTAINKPAAQ